MKDLAEFLKAIAWPSVALVALFVLRVEIIGSLQALQIKLENAKRVKFRLAGFNLELADEIARRAVSSGAPSTASAPETERAEFTRLDSAYAQVNNPTAEERAKARHPIADRLGALVVSLSLSRSELAVGSEGQRVALATAVVLDPRRGDLSCIERAAQNVEFKFTGYRLVLALISVTSNSRPSKKMIDRVQATLDVIASKTKAIDDPSLSRLIERTREAIDSTRS